MDPNEQLYKAVKQRNSQGVRTALESKANVNNRDYDDDPPLKIAVDSEDLQIVQQLLQNPEIDVNLSNDYGYTPLMSAAGYRSPKILTLLLLKNADVNLENQDGDTALDFAISANRINSVRELLKVPGIIVSEASINQANNSEIR